MLDARNYSKQDAIWCGWWKRLNESIRDNVLVNKLVCVCMWFSLKCFAQPRKHHIQTKTKHFQNQSKSIIFNDNFISIFFVLKKNYFTNKTIFTCLLRRLRLVHLFITFFFRCLFPLSVIRVSYFLLFFFFSIDEILLLRSSIVYKGIVLSFTHFYFCVIVASQHTRSSTNHHHHIAAR